MSLALPLDGLLAAGLGGACLAVLARWVREERGAAAGPAASSRRFWQCRICTAFYTAEPRERLTICPQCGSYNSEQGAQLS